MHMYKQILFAELLPALGCTEPISLALACAKGREIIEEEVERIDVYCSANIIKNVKAVTIPNSGGLKGIEAACALGLFGGNADKKLKVLQDVTKEHIKLAKEFINAGNIEVKHVKNEPNLYIRAELFSKSSSSSVEIKYDHTRINKIYKNGELILNEDIQDVTDTKIDLDSLHVKDIYDFANSIDINAKENEGLKKIIQKQIDYNYTIGVEGLRQGYGACIGKTLEETMSGGVCKELKTIALAAAGSDARMSGCSLPVVINSGSGNQDMTIAIPLTVFAKENGIEDEKLHRALIFANLIAIHQKRFIGKLSAFCGAVSASAATGAGLGYLEDCSYETICNIITNTLATTGGMVCDGAKPSCAAKIATSLNNAVMSLNMSKAGFVFQEGEGIVGKDIEETIENIGYMARVGMKSTDEEILKIMLHQQGKNDE